MDVLKILKELREEREQIEEAIISLERLVRDRSRRGGIPSGLTEVVRRGPGRPRGSRNKPKSENPTQAGSAASFLTHSAITGDQSCGI